MFLPGVLHKKGLFMTQQYAQHDHFPLLFQIALDLFRRPSPSGHEGLVRAYVLEHLERHGFAVSVDSIGNVLAERGVPALHQGYPLLSFHMDCVSSDAHLLADHTTVSSSSDVHDLCSSTEAFWGKRKRRGGEELSLRPSNALEITRGWLHSRGAFVLGGDDKCGGAIALTLAATTTLPLKIIASVQEEIGCVGIEQVDPRFFEDVAYALVLDRRGANHLIVSIAGQLLCQGAFAAAMMRAAATTGLLVYAAEGAFSDVLALSQYISNVVNLSVGYYRPHTAQEIVSLVDLWHSYQWVHEALRSLPCNQSNLDASTSDQAREEMLVCPYCQKLAIPPTELSEDLGGFVCSCDEAVLPLTR